MSGGMTTFSISNIAVLVSQECGHDACDKMIRNCGERRIAVPKGVHGKFLDILGEDVLKVLVRHYAGTSLDIPSRGAVERALRAHRLAQDISSSTKSANELATIHGVTAKHVHNIRRNILGRAERQLNKVKA